MLPNFLIIGAAKAGTTSLWKYCDAHPQIYMSRVKECGFFSYRDPTLRSRPPVVDIRTLDEYRRMFDEAGDAIAIGEASPQYLVSPLAPGRIHETLPDVRLVVSLREPAARAYSAYAMHVRQARAPADVRVAFEGTPSYVRRSFYFDNLTRYYDLFDRSRIQVHLFDDLSRNPSGVMADLFQFLGVDDTVRPDTGSRYNIGSVPRATWLNARVVEPLARRFGARVPGGLRLVMQRALYRASPPCPPELRDRLRRLFREDILKTQDLVRRDLSAWLS